MKIFLRSTLALLLLFGCGGDNQLDPDAGDTPDADNQPPPPPPQVITVSGQVTKLGAYLAGEGEYVGDAAVLAYGVNPPRNDTSALEGTVGAYTLSVPANGQLVFYTNKAGYFPTYNPVTVAQANINNQRLYLAELDWLNDIAGEHNVNLDNAFACNTAELTGQQCVYATVVGRILDDGTAGNGTPRPVAGVSANDFTVTGGYSGDAWYKRGPYFLDTDGKPYPESNYSVVEDYQGGLFITFVEVPQISAAPINLQLGIAYNDEEAGIARQFGPQSVQVFSNYGVTWSSIYETGIVPPPPDGPVDFDTQIYPLFLPVNQGGFGCQGCHTNQGGLTPAGGMNLYGGPDVAYASLDPDAYPQRVNTVSPEQSYVLQRPLYGSQNHPIFAFASPQDPAYQLILRWIREGAERNADNAPVSFRDQIRPLLYAPVAQGGAGCYACHVDGVNANNAPGGFYMGGTPEELYAAIVNDAATDNGGTGEGYRINKADYIENSLLLTNPLFGNPEPHPVKIFSSNLDPRYQLIYRWIAEGYQDDQ